MAQLWDKLCLLPEAHILTLSVPVGGDRACERERMRAPKPVNTQRPKNNIKCWVVLCVTVTPVLGRPRQEDCHESRPV